MSIQHPALKPSQSRNWLDCTKPASWVQTGTTRTILTACTHHVIFTNRFQIPNCAFITSKSAWSCKVNWTLSGSISSQAEFRLGVFQRKNFFLRRIESVCPGSSKQTVLVSRLRIEPLLPQRAAQPYQHTLQREGVNQSLLAGRLCQGFSECAVRFWRNTSVVQLHMLGSNTAQLGCRPTVWALPQELVQQT